VILLKCKLYFQDTVITDDYCGDYNDLNAWIDGKTPVSASAAVVFQRHVLTSLTVTTVYDDYTVVFAGTKTGKLIKVRDRV